MIVYFTVVVIKYHNISTDMENKLIEMLKVHPVVISVVKTLGEWDIELYVETDDVLSFRQFERQLRQDFLELIKNIETVSLYYVHKKNYFPQYLA